MLMRMGVRAMAVIAVRVTVQVLFGLAGRIRAVRHGLIVDPVVMLMRADNARRCQQVSNERCNSKQTGKRATHRQISRIESYLHHEQPGPRGLQYRNPIAVVSICRVAN